MSPTELKRCNSEKCSRNHMETKTSKAPRIRVYENSELENQMFPAENFMTTSSNKLGLKRKKFSSHSTGYLTPITQRTMWNAIERDDVIEQSKSLCRDYVVCRMKRSGYRGKVFLTKTASSSNKRLSMALLNAGHTMENRYPHLYRNLARQLGYVIKSEDVLKHLFYKLSKQVMGENPMEFTWCRILSLFCIAAALAVDCVVQGHCEFIERLIEIFSDFIEQYALTWIMNHGGWATIEKHFSKVERKSSDTSHHIFKLFRAATTWLALTAGIATAGCGAYYASKIYIL